MGTVNGKVQVTIDLKHLLANDFGNAVLPAFRQLLIDVTSGTGDGQFDVAFFDDRAPGASSETLDLVGSLVDAFGTTVSPVEIGLILVINTGSAAIKVGSAASNQAYSGLFNAATDALVVGAAVSASLPGFALWYAPDDGGGLQLAAGTADQLKVAAVSGNATYSIVLLGRSA